MYSLQELFCGFPLIFFFVLRMFETVRHGKHAHCRMEKKSKNSYDGCQTRIEFNTMLATKSQKENDYDDSRQCLFLSSAVFRFLQSTPFVVGFVRI